MRIQPILVLSVLCLGLAACKPPEGLPRLEAKGPPPAPVAAPAPVPRTAPAPVEVAAAPPAPPCACPQQAKAAPDPRPTSIHDRPAQPHARVRAPRSVRQADHRARRRVTAGSGYRVNAYAGGDYRRVETDERRGGVYAERSVQAYDYEQSSEARVSESSAYGGAYVAGGHGGGYYGAQQSTARDYSVSRTARGDAARSRAWTRVRCADGQYRYEWR